MLKHGANATGGPALTQLSHYLCATLPRGCATRDADGLDRIYARCSRSIWPLECQSSDGLAVTAGSLCGAQNGCSILKLASQPAREETTLMHNDPECEVLAV